MSPKTTKASAANEAPEQIEGGRYRYLGFEIRRVNSKRWDIFDTQNNKVGTATSLKGATTVAEQLKTGSAGQASTKTARAAASKTGKGAAPSKAKTEKEPKAKKQPKEKDPDLLGHKITRQTVKEIRDGWDALPDGKGKMEYYRTTAKRLGLGLETVAKIARRDIYPEV